ncbi:unnamed protein product [Brassica napus]|nr:unnamed protein product [Brassica napus]
MAGCSSSSTVTNLISTVHHDIIEAHILTVSTAPTLASVSCASSHLHELASNEILWSKLRRSTWPSTAAFSDDDSRLFLRRLLCPRHRRFSFRSRPSVPGADLRRGCTLQRKLIFEQSREDGDDDGVVPQLASEDRSRGREGHGADADQARTVGGRHVS